MGHKESNQTNSLVQDQAQQSMLGKSKLFDTDRYNYIYSWRICFLKGDVEWQKDLKNSQQRYAKSSLFSKVSEPPPPPPPKKKKNPYQTSLQKSFKHVDATLK